MKYSSIIHYDIANGEGVRTSLFVSGCNFHCKDCFNKEAQSFSYGHTYTDETEQEIINLIENPNIAGLSLLGGDPLCQSDEDIKILIRLAQKAKENKKTTWLWTGFTWEEIFGENKDTPQKVLVENCDLLIDGRFISDQRDLRLKWRGSSNQRVIDIKKSLDTGRIIIYE